MAMDLNARAAYIRGLMKGMEFDAASPNGKVIAAMMDLLDEMAAAVTEHDGALDELADEVAAIGDDLDGVAADLYGEDAPDADDAEGDEAMYEVTCPNCNTVTAVDEETLLREQLVCPKCGAAFDIELEPTEEEKPDPIFVLPEEMRGR